MAPFPIADQPRHVEELAREAPYLFPKRAQDAVSHIRHVTPGDYREKLKTSTIRQLNEIFAATLDRLGYERDPA
jgi:hypothetical protein